MTSVLHVITGLGAGGAETMLVQLATALQARGLPQHVVSLKGRDAHADSLEAGGVPVTALEIGSIASAPLGELRLAGLVRRLRPEIIQGWMYHGNLAAAIAHKLSPGADRRLIWNLRSSNMDNERYGRLIAWNARLSSWPALIIANSNAGCAFHKEHGFRPGRMEMIPNGVDTRKYRPDRAMRDAIRRELNLSRDKKVAILVARVDLMKDHDTFLAAMAANPDVQGLLAGLATERLDLPGNVRALGLRSDIPRLHAAADIVVSSSAFGEGFSNAIAEGMASGLVPVVTDVGDARLIVGDTGRVVPARDPDALARAIEAETAKPGGELRRAGLAARKRIEENFTLQKAVDAYAEIYQGGAG